MLSRSAWLNSPTRHTPFPPGIDWGSKCLHWIEPLLPSLLYNLAFLTFFFHLDSSLILSQVNRKSLLKMSISIEIFRLNVDLTGFGRKQWLDWTGFESKLNIRTAITLDIEAFDRNRIVGSMRLVLNSSMNVVTHFFQNMDWAAIGNHPFNSPSTVKSYRRTYKWFLDLIKIWLFISEKSNSIFRMLKQYFGNITVLPHCHSPKSTRRPLHASNEQTDGTQTALSSSINAINAQSKIRSVTLTFSLLCIKIKRF